MYWLEQLSAPGPMICWKGALDSTFGTAQQGRTPASFVRMPPQATASAGRPGRKRNRKRKRRIASSSSSSSADESLSDVSTSSVQKSKIPLKPPPPDASEEDPSSSSSSPSSSEPEKEVDENSTIPDHGVPQPSVEKHERDSPSPPPPTAVAIPPFMAPGSSEDEQVLKEKFRKFWMASLAEGFKDDLEQLRKEPNLGPSRLALLVESLAAGADVFDQTGGGVNEMAVVVDEQLSD
ncbi:hypothetical protein V8B97DRAFT_170850 [Scleroderma yunnanense]